MFSNRVSSGNSLKNRSNSAAKLSHHEGEAMSAALTGLLFVSETLNTETDFQNKASMEGIPLVLTSLGIGKEDGKLKE